MSEFSAFLAGLILGDTAPARGSHKKSAELKTNVALQDVVFCQCLKNIIDGLYEYVNATHPTPEQFIRYLLPDTSGFTEPYTDEEKKTIDDNEAAVRAYVKWINVKTENKRLAQEFGSILAREHFGDMSPLTGGDKWEDLDVIHMIWQDEEHTPDPDNLDLLFGQPVLGAPIKRDGRVYEYEGTSSPDGLAKGFFESIPARYIRAAAIRCSMQVVESNGFSYDQSRFEYKAFADGSGTSEAWKLYQRILAYKSLKSQHPEFCKSAWSDWTRRELKYQSVANTYDVDYENAKMYEKLYQRLHPFASQNNQPREAKVIEEPRDENQRLRKERVDIWNKLTQDERKEFWAIGLCDESLRKRKNQCEDSAISLVQFAIGGIISGIVLLIITFIVGAVYDLWDNEQASNIIIMILSAIFVIGLITYIVWRVVATNKREALRVDILHFYLQELQASYYANDGSDKAKRYEELLQRIKK